MVHIGGREFLAGFQLFVRGFGTRTEPADRSDYRHGSEESGCGWVPLGHRGTRAGDLIAQ